MEEESNRMKSKKGQAEGSEIPAKKFNIQLEFSIPWSCLAILENVKQEQEEERSESPFMCWHLKDV